jgi:hypothetical protein
VTEENLKISLKYYGISPWEIEVVYGYLNARFTVIQEEIASNDENFVSFLNLEIPIAFSEEFFRWFEYRRWEKIKDLFKEMKRRRGSGNALKIMINFSGNPRIVFVLDTEDKHWYDNAVEKIDFVLELLPYHLDPKKIPSDVLEIIYKFDHETARWRLNTATSESKKYVFRGDTWSMVT